MSSLVPCWMLRGGSLPPLPHRASGLIKVPASLSTKPVSSTPQDDASVTGWAGPTLLGPGASVWPQTRGGVGALGRNTDSRAPPPEAKTFGIGIFNQLLLEQRFTLQLATLWPHLNFKLIRRHSQG